MALKTQRRPAFIAFITFMTFIAFIVAGRALRMALAIDVPEEWTNEGPGLGVGSGVPTLPMVTSASSSTVKRKTST